MQEAHVGPRKQQDEEEEVVQDREWLPVGRKATRSAIILSDSIRKFAGGGVSLSTFRDD